jgi:nicotinamide mononucleotide transporter
LSLLERAWAALAAVPAAEWAAVLLALGYLLLAIRQNSWCWACAVTSAVLYAVLFARGGLIMQALLQVYYIALAVYGWRAWRGTGGAGPLPVRRWPLRWHVAAWLVVALVAAINGALLAGAGEPALVRYADALIAWASVLTSWLVARKVLENWLYWIVIDTGAAALYVAQGFNATAVLFLLYAALAVRGYASWRRDYVATGAARA